MYYMVFDTETTGLDKPFCYDVGYAIYNEEIDSPEIERHFVVEQIWHNLPLFESAYYKEKRPKYIQRMRKQWAIMDKWGYIMRAMYRDIKKYNITDAYAYNSAFDDKVFTFNCDWFKCNNPLEMVAIHDIWGYASEFITCTSEYQAFCEKYKYFTDAGNYKTSAEIVYRYLTENIDFNEEHMGLMDTRIENKILSVSCDMGAEWGMDYNVVKILPRNIEKPFTIKVNGKIIHTGNYIKKYVKQDVYSFTTADK